MGWQKTAHIFSDLGRLNPIALNLITVGDLNGVDWGEGTTPSPNPSGLDYNEKIIEKFSLMQIKKAIYQYQQFI